MRRFRFRLERVLSARTAIEHLCESHLASARMALASAQDTRERICLRAKAARERLRHEIGRCFSPHDVAWAEEHLSDLGSLEQAQIAVVEDSIKEVARRRDELLAARRDRRALEKLRQRRFSEHRYLMGREEAGELDDMFGSRREVR